MGGRKRTYLSIVIKPEIKKKLQKLAEKEGRNVSEIVRELIVKKLKEARML